MRTLVTTELAGTIEMRRALRTDGVEAQIEMAADGQGTVVDLRVPISSE